MVCLLQRKSALSNTTVSGIVVSGMFVSRPIVIYTKYKTLTIYLSNNLTWSAQDLLLGSQCCFDIHGGLSGRAGAEWGKTCCDNEDYPVARPRYNLTRHQLDKVGSTWCLVGYSIVKTPTPTPTPTQHNTTVGCDTKMTVQTTPPHPTPTETFQPLLDQLESWNLAQIFTRPI